MDLNNNIMTKEEQILEKNAAPIKIGDRVLIQTIYEKSKTETVGKGKNKQVVTTTEKTIFGIDGKVLAINDTSFKISMNNVNVPYELNAIITVGYDDKEKYGIVPKGLVYRTFYECGANPFGKEKRQISFYNQDIGSIIHKAGYGRKNQDYNIEELRHGNIAGINFNPFVTDANGVKQHFQRDFVWTIEENQMLLESIYNSIEIGKFLFRYNAWKRIEQAEANGETPYSFDCVDGKQRFNAILTFLQNKYPDAHGSYWSDLSNDAQRRFMNYSNLSYGELPETATDEDVIDNFLTLNFTGVPMSAEHIAYVKSFNMK